MVERSIRITRLHLRMALVVWAVSASVGSAYLLAGHLLTLPTPERSATEVAIGRLRTHGDDGRWFALHVLSAECQCSRKVFDHLLVSRRPIDLSEKILLVGDQPDLKAAANRRGFQIEVVSSDELVNTYHLDAAPLLVISDPHGRVRYSGGYSDRKQSPRFWDLDIIERLKNGAETTPLPLFGCAVSKALKRTLNPLAQILE